MKQEAKYIFSTLIIALAFLSIKAQRSKLINDGPNDKYFISFAYGTGNASWSSTLNQSALYDTTGSEIFGGNVLFNAKNTLNNFTVDVGAQVMKVRLGLGISFEEFYLEKIKINNVNYAFADRFTFSKIFAHAEIPFQNIGGDLFSFSIKTGGGYFTSYYLNHYNLFGSGTGGKSVFFNLGFIADYKLFAHTYLFVQPVVEYKYFKNSKQEAPSKITHNIWSYFIMSGLRIDVSKE